MACVRPVICPSGCWAARTASAGELVFRAHNPAGVRLEDLDLPLAVELRPRTGAPRPGRWSRPARFRRAGRPVRWSDWPVSTTGIRRPGSPTASCASPRSLLPPLDKGEFYVADLIGCQVKDWLVGRAAW